MNNTSERAVIVYTTFAEPVEAERVAEQLIARKLCACANLFPGMISLYHWQGKCERTAEVAVILKTRASLADELCAALRGLHSYETPAIAVIPVEHMDADYLRWLVAETTTPA